MLESYVLGAYRQYSSRSSFPFLFFKEKHRHTVTLCCLFRKITMIPLMLSSFDFSDIFLGLLLMSVGETS